jgi:SAM-dependent methyltransferase
MTQQPPGALANYGIRPDFRPNPENRARRDEGAVYWSARQISNARSYQWQVYAWGREIIRERKLESCVDVGCGPAIKFEELIVPAVHTAVGIDQRSIIEYCRRTYRAEQRYLVNDLESPNLELGFEPDLMICCDVVEHLVDPDVLMRDLHRLSGPSTLLLISTPDRDRVRGPGALSVSNRDHVREWTFAEFRSYLDSSGFDIVECRHLAPFKARFDLLTFMHAAELLRPGRSWRYNMAFLCRPRG